MYAQKALAWATIDFFFESTTIDFFKDNKHRVFRYKIYKPPPTDQID